MPENGSPGERAESAGPPTVVDVGGAAPPWRRPRPRVVVRRDLLPAVSVLSTVSLLGIPLGWLWAELAPGQQLRVGQGGRLTSLPLESYHLFDDIGIFLLLTFAAGLLAGGAVWLLRQRRGPVVMVAAAAGSLLAAWLATRMGLTFAEIMYPQPGGPVPVGTVLHRPPRLESAWVVLAQPLATLLTYGACAAWNGRDDLGRRLG
ncbi:hypothetical protein GCM10012275_05810 [Longimycelium tulufanense]|uniref:DUF2567 domain-containing protein n=1 Tax=Longimycelium tulufanense TaxID=907463 RepID=A0A8J3FTV4_9PSEU|nr:DUF2567 domain-containing protein [Longimycelium tulufanense]GGM37622.1 hypothetical protein GCM10012275_05810 [Longimycelium tulufanense]